MSLPTKPQPTSRRREQQRAVETRLTILKAALPEFADKGFDAASLRTIAERTGLQHPLITYHYRTKEILWKAVAEHVFNLIVELWDEGVPADTKMAPIERVREEYKAFFKVTLDFPDLHHFILRESHSGNPRMAWLAENLLKPLMSRLLPQIEAAQASGDLPPGDPVLLHYMLIGMTTVLSSLGADMSATSGRSPENPAVVANYWALLETVIFNKASGHRGQ
ncbi:TetR/AcrR family transcriptional regulator [Undibacterium terreum]|uniref:TetR family transcriptional regulator n=1 Tax=Undibacterium terreum TaxID=1224302 RepID=A0A916V0Z5_9BURK|nr:TetR/AcrR family transcriptional regulator [Undibacterium terreum]GGD00628.1 TetR family transcriptional regulator [Undibacterium terreum]